MLCFKSQIIPLEVVVRNRLAGSTAKRLGFKEGSKIKTPLLEFYYKKDELNDPFISEEQIIKLNLIQDPVKLLPLIKTQAFLINQKLKPVFLKSGLELIDFKMEFGLCANKLLLADDISPDSARIWDKTTGKRLDKDRFRRDWGDIQESYKTIESKLYKTWNL